MRHPELFIIPAFMLTDYFLTLISQGQRSKRYGDHFKAEHYELNPLWQKAVAQRKWFNPRHLLLTLFLSVLLVLLLESSSMPEPLAQGVLGGLLVFFSSLIGRHLCNLLTFRHINRKPNEISGQVTMTHGFLLSMSLYQYVVVLVPMVLVAVFSPTPFAIGGLCGVVLLLAGHLRWIRRHNRKKKSLDKAEASDAG